MTVEYATLLKEIERGSQASHSVSQGSYRSLRTSHDHAGAPLMRSTSCADHQADGNFGKGRFLLRMSVPKLTERVLNHRFQTGERYTENCPSEFFILQEDQ